LEWHYTKYTKKVDLFSKKYLTETGWNLSSIDAKDNYIYVGLTNNADGSQTQVLFLARDTTPPEFTLSVTPDKLWLVNHKMVEIAPSWVLSDLCDPTPKVSLVSITNSEDDANGDGNKNDDIQIIDGEIYLRAERSGLGNGRIYTITYQAVDNSGNLTLSSATVTVPHNKGSSKK
jgi:hypothetical protein